MLMMASFASFFVLAAATAATTTATAAQTPDLAKLLGAPLADKVPGYILWPALMLAAAGAIVGFITVFDLFAVWLERKVSARMQCRLGPMEVGPVRFGGGGSRVSGFRVGPSTFVGGLLQTIADGVKLLAKEDIIPAAADKPLYIVGPIIVFLGVFGLFVVLPFGPDLIVSDLDVGLFYVAAIGSLEAIGVMMSGWASNNKWSLFGTIRAATQVVSYEIPLSLAFVTVIAIAGTFSMQEMVRQQGNWFFSWFFFANPFTAIAFFIFFIAALAQVKRAPFDLPEAESELVSGFHTEYSGMRFSIFFLSEYAAMYAISAIAVVVFFGGWMTGIKPIDQIGAAPDATTGAKVLGNVIGLGAIVGKSIFFVFVQMWLRWTLPRIRLDQVMHLCLKVLLPIAIVCMIGASLWEYFLPGHVLWFIPGVRHP